jgi:hypothetical protein
MIQFNKNLTLNNRIKNNKKTKNIKKIKLAGLKESHVELKTESYNSIKISCRWI